MSRYFPGMWGENDCSRRRSRVFVIEDHPTTRHAIIRILDHSEDFDSCGFIATSVGAVEAVERSHADIVLLDLSLPDGAGLTLLPALLEVIPRVRILVFTAFEEETHAASVMRSGAHGFLNKQASSCELLNALRKVASGDFHAKPKTLQVMTAKLSQREEEIFRLVGKGLSSGDIAFALGISMKTVDAHKANIREKMGYADSLAMYRDAVIHHEKTQSPTQGDGLSR